MLDRVKSFEDLRVAFPNDRACRQLLESIIWRRGRFCPHCGGLKTWAIRGKTARYGLYECAYCHHQFTVTTRTPLHATKLPLKKWIQAFFLVLTSSKGISSVVLARLLGVNQKTAWKMGHAIREMMDLRQEEGPALDGIVEADEKFIGGRPKFKRASSTSAAAAPTSRRYSSQWPAAGRSAPRSLSATTGPVSNRSSNVSSARRLRSSPTRTALTRCRAEPSPRTRW